MYVRHSTAYIIPRCLRNLVCCLLRRLKASPLHSFLPLPSLHLHVHVPPHRTRALSSCYTACSKALRNCLLLGFSPPTPPLASPSPPPLSPLACTHVTSQDVCPVLVLYSPSDQLASPHYVRRFIAALRDKGGSVSSVCFPHSKHVGECFTVHTLIQYHTTDSRVLTFCTMVQKKPWRLYAGRGGEGRGHCGGNRNEQSLGQRSVVPK